MSSAGVTLPLDGFAFTAGADGREEGRGRVAVRCLRPPLEGYQSLVQREGVRIADLEPRAGLEEDVWTIDGPVDRRLVLARCLPAPRQHVTVFIEEYGFETKFVNISQVADNAGGDGNIAGFIVDDDGDVTRLRRSVTRLQG